MECDVGLLPFERGGFGRLLEWATSPEALVQWAGLAFTFPLDVAQLEKYIRLSEGENPTRKIYKAVEAGSERVVGHIELDRLNLQNGTATVSRVLVDPALRGKGFGGRMTKKILEISFEELSLHRIDLAVFDFNTAAIACYEKIGFKKEGHLRDTARVGDSYWSVYLMSILEPEWRAIEAQNEKKCECDV